MSYLNTMNLLLALCLLQDAAAIRAAAEKALPLIQKSAGSFSTKAACFSCHHQTLPILALSTAQARGLRVEGLEALKKTALEELDPAPKAALPGSCSGSDARPAWGLWTLELLGQGPGPASNDLGRRLATRLLQAPLPVHESALALRALSKYRVAANHPGVSEWARKELEELSLPRSKNSLEKAARILALYQAGRLTHDVAEDLVREQRGDGGWSPTPLDGSEPGATAYVLASLHAAGALKSSDPVYRKGLGFLIATQKPDGSWHTRSSARPRHPGLDSGFPYNRDAVASLMTSCWALSVLADGLDP